MEALLTTADVARLLGVGEVTVTRWRKKGILPSVKLGRNTVKFDPRDVEKFIAARRAAPKAKVPRE